MPRTKQFVRSFAGGEIGPDLLGRVDVTAFLTGAQRVRNMLVKPQGAVTRRPGTQYLGATKFNAEARLIPFVFSAAQTAVVEIGCPPTVVATATTVNSTQVIVSGTPWTADAYKGMYVVCGGAVAKIAGNTNNTLTLTGAWSPATPTTSLDFIIYIGYFRFWVDGVAVTHPSASPWSNLSDYNSGDFVTDAGLTWFARIASDHTAPKQPSLNPDYWYAQPTTGQLELPHRFAAEDLFELTYTQSFDVLSIAHEVYAPTELRRLGAQTWSHTNVVFGASVSAPTGVGNSTHAGVQLALVSSVAHVVLATYNTALFTSQCPHGFVNGDTVYIQGTGSANYDGKFWVIAWGAGYTTNLYEFLLRDPLTGAWGPNTATTGGTAEYVTPNTNRSNVYCVTAVDVHNVESVASSTTTAVNNLYVVGAYNTITWNRVTGATRYRVYKKELGIFGLLAEVDDDGVGPTFSYKDDNSIAPDLGYSPPTVDTPFTSDYPAAVGYFQQRRCYGGTYSFPQNLWMTRVGTESDLSFHLPLKDDDRIAQRLSSLSVNRIRHLVPLNQLLVLTDTAEFRVSPVNTDAITPESFAARPQSYVGANRVRPLASSNTVLFASTYGGHVREMRYNLDSDSYVPGDLSLRAAHLFDELTIRDAALQRTPMQIAWFVSSDGSLLSLTYAPEEQVNGWAKHTTDGSFEAVCVVNESGEDRVYVIVRRVINSVTVRYVERLYVHAFASVAASNFLDCAKEYTSIGTYTNLTGMDHLKGEEVTLLVDGIVLPPTTVSSAGVVTLNRATASSRVLVGLPYTSELKTLPVVLQTAGSAQAEVKNIVTVKIRTVDSSSFRIGRDSDDGELVESEDQAPAALGDIFTSSTMADAVVRVDVPGEWDDEGSVLIQQVYPLPLTVVSMAVEVELGGV